jgi:multiple sugar transport system substrate-binding protein
MKKRYLGMVAIAATVLAATTACSQSSNAPAGDQTISFWHSFNSDSQEVKTLETVLIPAFEKANPGITVTSVSVPYEDLHQKLVTAVAGGQLPDVVRSDIIWVPELANLGVLEPLDTLMPDFDALSAAVYPGPLATNKWKDHYYGLPLDTNTRVLLSDADLFASAGVAVPVTQQDVVDAAPAIRAKGAAVFADNDLSGWNVLPWIWSAGGDITDPNVTKASGYLNSPESLSAIELLYKLYKSGDIPSILVQGGKDGTEDGLATGAYASVMNGPWDYPIIAGSYPDFEIHASQVPSGAGGSISVVGGEDVVVTKSSEHKDAAAKFVSYLLSPDAQRAMAEIGQMSVLTELGPEMTSIQPYYAEFVKQLATAKPRPATPAWPEVDQALKTGLQDAFINGKDLKTTLDELAAQLDGILAKY